MKYFTGHHVSKTLKVCKYSNDIEKMDDLPCSPIMGNNFISYTKNYLHWRHVLGVFSEMSFNHCPGSSSAVPQSGGGFLGLMCAAKKAKPQGTTVRRAAIHC